MKCYYYNEFDNKIPVIIIWYDNDDKDEDKDDILSINSS